MRAFHPRPATGLSADTFCVQVLRWVLRQAAGTALCLAVCAAGGPGMARAQNPFNCELAAGFRRTTHDAFAGVWGYTAPDGRELAIVGMSSGTAFVDVTQPAAPFEVGFVPGPRSHWREIQTWSHYAYIVTEAGGGMQIVDLADPAAPRFVGSYMETFYKAHTLHARDGFLYVNGTNDGWRILDLADPEHPRDVGAWYFRYVHDCFVRGNRAYLCNINTGGFTILDIRDKANPVELAFVEYVGSSCHNAWTTEDGRWLFTTDETPGGHLRVWNVENPYAVTQVAEWSASPTATIHNVVVKGDSAYIAYYTEGLQVLDISTPAWPLLAASYDTYPAISGGMKGAWGVYPSPRNGIVYVSDMVAGLQVLRLLPASQPLDLRLTAPGSQAIFPGTRQARFYFELYNGAATTRAFDLEASSSLGWPVHVEPAISIRSSGAEAIPVTVDVPEGIAGPARLDVELCTHTPPLPTRVCVRSQLAVPVLLSDLQAEAGTEEVTLRWRLAGLDSQGRAAGGEASSLRLVVARAVEDRRARRGDLEFETLAVLVVPASAAAWFGEWTDAGVTAGTAYRYRLRLESAGATRVLGELSVALPLSATPGTRSRLLGASPNPFGPATHIAFELARAGEVRLDIFDMRGRRVRSLIRHAAPASRNAFEWDGRDDRGRRLPAGVYAYALRSAAWTAHGRVTMAP